MSFHIEPEEKEKLSATLVLVNRNLAERKRSILRLDELDLDEYVYNALVRQLATRIKNLENALSSPYFARIDFIEEAGGAANRYYIGRVTVLDNERLAVIDWRAPVSSVYYEGALGKVSYMSPGGLVSGELELKRQYRIENGALLQYQDIDITTNDEFLQSVLSADSEIRLKNIVATIQSEQNRIIRADMRRPLIVQGVAGSGKTTVALHRIAYLAYTYEEKIRPEEFLILAPNKFLLDYVSGVLPDLGVDFVRQETIEDFVGSIIPDKITIESVTAMYDGAGGGGTSGGGAKGVSRGASGARSAISAGGDAGARGTADKADRASRDADRFGGGHGKADEGVNGAEKVARFKTGLDFQNAIDSYLSDLNSSILSNQDLICGRYLLIKHGQLQSTFMDLADRLSIAERVNRLRVFMLNWMENNAETLAGRILVESKRIIANCPSQMSGEKKKARESRIQSETDAAVKELRGGGRRLVADYIKKIRLGSVWEHYKAIMSDDALFEPYLDEESVSFARESFARYSRKKTVTQEDIPALLYLRYKIFGLDEKFSLKHIIIDEAQDFGLFMYYSLNQILGCKSMTILGDLAQGIYARRGLDSWESLNESIFDGEADIEYMRISYRTTIEIIQEANKVLSRMKVNTGAGPALPAIRHGKEVNYRQSKDFADTFSYVAGRITDLKNEERRNIAVISRTEKTGKAVYEYLRESHIDAHHLSGISSAYEGGVSVMPAYLSKGLEFDSVILMEADSGSYLRDDRDAKLLYVAMTRAMHSLDILYEGALTELLS